MSLHRCLVHVQAQAAAQMTCACVQVQAAARGAQALGRPGRSLRVREAGRPCISDSISTCDAVVLLDRYICSACWRRLAQQTLLKRGLRPSLAWQVKDDQGFQGVKLSKDLVKVAGQALTANLAVLGGRCLPVSEKAKYAWAHFQRKVCFSILGVGCSEQLPGSHAWQHLPQPSFSVAAAATYPKSLHMPYSSVAAQRMAMSCCVTACAMAGGGCCGMLKVATCCEGAPFPPGHIPQLWCAWYR